MTLGLIPSINPLLTAVLISRTFRCPRRSCQETIESLGATLANKALPCGVASFILNR